jgi:hypothetical protein
VDLRAQLVERLEQPGALGLFVDNLHRNAEKQIAADTARGRRI